MVFYIRKVEKNKWDYLPPEDGDHLHMGTDGVTNCCKTSNNTLSIWETPNNNPDSNENKKIIVAINTAGDRPSTTDFIFISDAEISQLGVSISHTPDSATTLIKSMKCKHYDIKDLNIDSLGKIGMLIHQKVNDDKQIYRKTVGEIKKETVSLFPDKTPEANDIKTKDNWAALYK
ncbi:MULTISPECIES: hypothetical protein [Klebsiella pneumoniae complex]|nr:MULTISPECIES: hypothetical protein [Klebsiella]HBQ3115390.1 hypothetical protein [Klebsiella quasipneumoniae subsp. similipneumoniae]APV14944.1 hypothetical protein BWG70_15290 [Klebsiella pneumoniae]EIX9324374.1 hypothetical protein [Klebsiella pneumoniae]KMH39150.1 hypothetical protein SM72_01365 [Klebsiella pneumoniae]MCA4940794.1 hypothetical protein [Klebsiella pneumoniae]